MPRNKKFRYCMTKHIERLGKILHFQVFVGVFGSYLESHLNFFSCNFWLCDVKKQNSSTAWPHRLKNKEIMAFNRCWRPCCSHLKKKMQCKVRFDDVKFMYWMAR